MLLFLLVEMLMLLFLLIEMLMLMLLLFLLIKMFVLLMRLFVMLVLCLLLKYIRHALTHWLFDGTLPVRTIDVERIVVVMIFLILSVCSVLTHWNLHGDTALLHLICQLLIKFVIGAFVTLGGIRARFIWIIAGRIRLIWVVIASICVSLLLCLLDLDFFDNIVTRLFCILLHFFHAFSFELFYWLDEVILRNQRVHMHSLAVSHTAVAVSLVAHRIETAHFLQCATNRLLFPNFLL